MPKCCVYKCNRREGHCFPKDPKLKQLCLHAVTRKNFTPTERSVVCSAHFLSSDYISESREGGYTLVRKRLRPNIVPSIFHSNGENVGDSKETEAGSAQAKRTEQRREQLNEIDPDQEIKTDSETNHMLDTLEFVGVVEEVVEEERIAPTGGSHTESKLLVNTACQTTKYVEPRFSIASFVDNHKAINFYTGLENYTKFSLVLNSLGPAASRLNYYNSQVRNLSVENQFFLTLIKLRFNRQMLELSVMFDISVGTVSNIFNTWVSFMALQWGELNIWPSQELVKHYMPQDCKKSYKILKHQLNTNLVAFESEIYFVCAMLCNFRAGKVAMET